MAQKKQPFWGNNQQPRVPPKINPQIVIVYDPESKAIDVKTNVEDLNLVSGMLIDAMSSVHRTRVQGEAKKIVTPTPRLIVPS